MTPNEAIKQLDGASLMLFNRNYDDFNKAIIMAINALKKEVEKGKDKKVIKNYKKVVDKQAGVW